jgi:hypothetical protein
MRPSLLGGWSLLGSGAQICPALVLLIFYLRCAVRRRGKRRARTRSGGDHPGFSASTFSLGMALQNMEMLIRPGVEYTIQEIYDEDAEQDGEGNPDDPSVLLHRQLRRIRRGEPVERLTVRMR